MTKNKSSSNKQYLELFEELPPKIKKEVEEKLKNLKLSKKEKEFVISEIVKEYLKARVDPGEPIGLVAAQSLTEPATQLILRSFHYVGISEFQVSLGLPRFEEILDGRTKIKEKYMIIPLKEPYCYDKEKAIEIAKKIREIRLKDLLKEIGIDIFNKKLILYLNKDILKEFDVSIEEIISTLKKKSKKLEIEEYTEDTIIIKYKSKKESIRDFYEFKDTIRNLYIRGIKGIRDVVTMYEDGKWKIYTYGSNLLEIIKIPEVDYTKVFTNDIAEIEKVLGIEAARESIVRQITQLLEQQGLSIDVRYILLVADVLTWYGTYKGITRYGVHEEKTSVLAKAAFETPIKHFVKASMIAEDDEVKTGIEHVMMNQIIPFGTGYFYVKYEPIKENKTSKKSKTSKKKKT